MASLNSSNSILKQFALTKYSSVDSLLSVVACNVYGGSEIPTLIFYEGHLFQTFGDLENGYVIRYCKLSSQEQEELKHDNTMLEVNVFSTDNKKYKVFTGGDLRSDRIYVMISAPVFSSIVNTAMRIVERREIKNTSRV
jgi:hypothetical protein